MGKCIAFAVKMKSHLYSSLEYNFNLYTKKYKIKNVVKNTLLFHSY